MMNDDDDDDDLSMKMMNLQQWMAHAGSFFPHRLVCYYLQKNTNGLCVNEEYTSEGISKGIYESFVFYQSILEWISTTPVVVQSIAMVGLMTLLCISWLVESFTILLLFMNKNTTILIMMGIAAAFVVAYNNYVSNN